MDQNYSKIKFSQWKKIFFTLCLIYGLSFTAIFRANFNYVDDLKRVQFGMQGFTFFSRYMAEFLSGFIHADTFLADISPLTQIIAVAVLALSSTILIFAYSGESTDVSPWQIAAALPLGLSPYFLSCISYKYDSPYMALSILAMVFPILFEKKSRKVYFLAVFLGTLLMCTTYQAASGIFPMIVVSLTLSRWNQGEDIRKLLQYVCLSAIAYCAGLLFFYTVIMHFFEVEGYASTAMFSVSKLLRGSLSNLKHYYVSCGKEFRGLWIILILALAVEYLIINTVQSCRNKWAAFFVALAALLTMCCLTFGVYIVLKKPIFEARAKYGIGALLAIISVQCSTFRIPKKKLILRLTSLALSWCFIVFSFTYGNVLSETKRYSEFRIELLITDLTNCEGFNSEDEKFVQLTGDIGKSPAAQLRYDRYAVLDELVPNLLTGWDDYWGDYYFFNYYGLKHVTRDFNVDMQSMNLPMIKDTMYHTIRSDGTYFLIDLK